MSINSKNAIIKTKIENEIYELMVKTKVDNIYIDDSTTLASKLSEIITTLNTKAKSEDVTTEINTAISNLINGAPETYDTLKEIADYISSHAEVVEALNTAIGNKVDKVSGKGLSTNDFTTTLKNKLDGIASGAEVNQNTFSKVKVGDTTISSTAKTDTVTFVAGDNIELTPNTTSKTVTIKANAPSYTVATQSADGIMSSTDKKKLDGIAAGATANVGTITGIKMNGSSKGTSGVVDLGTVITAHQTLPTSLPASDVYSWAKAENKPTYTASEVGALASTVTHLSGDISTSEKGVSGGVATLGTDGKVPSSQLPSYVDDVVEYSDKSKFPTTGAAGKIYVDLATNLTWRWGGTTYVEISPSIAIGTTSGTALDGKTGNDHISSTSNPHNVTKSQIGLGNVENKSSATIRGELTKSDVTTALGYTPPTTNTTYSDATQSSHGLMSTTDKTKLDGIATGANKTTVDTAMSSTSTNPVQNKVIYAAIGTVNTAVSNKPDVYIQSSQPTNMKANDIWISF